MEIASGFVLLAVSSWWMAGWNLEVTVGPVFWTGLMQGLGAGSIIGPLGLLTFASLAAGWTIFGRAQKRFAEYV